MPNNAAAPAENDNSTPSSTSNNDQPTPTSGDPAAPSDTDSTTDTTTDPAAEVEKWRTLARKHEQRAKANAQKAQQYDAHVESQKTEQQRLNDAKATAEREATQARAELAVHQAAIKHGLTADDVELLGSHGTPDEIEARAKRLAERLKDSERPVDLGQGKRGTPPGTGADMTTAIRRAAGRL